MAEAFAFSLTAAVNPTLFAALMVMLVSDNAKRLMIGYLLGAYLTSIVCGLVIVFALPESSAVSTSKNTLSPAVDLALGFLLIVTWITLWSGPHERVSAWRETRKQKKAKKGPPRWRRALDEGSQRLSFVVGMALSLPGASYLIALDLLHKQDAPTLTTVLCVIAFCLIQLILLEIPVAGFLLAPKQTVAAVDRFHAWIGRDAYKILTRAALVGGVLLLVRGALELL
ncbi:MAG: GAP family protein [Actinobacteria bacterium]|nr:GAP family protein [Actinomycetota bacterium]